MSTRHLVSTNTRETTCRRCGAAVLTALDEGLTATVDPKPIPPNNEVAILLTGRRTYTKTNGGQLIHREAGRIRGGWLRGTIHAEHQCRQNGPQPEQLTLDMPGVR
jgi:hypothetical protein